MKLELTDKQVLVVMEALDHYSRTGMGQLEDVAHLLEKYYPEIKDKWELIEKHIRPLKRAAFHWSGSHSGNGSWSITSHKIPEPFRMAYEMQQVIRGDEHPLKTTTEPLCKIIQ